MTSQPPYEQIIHSYYQLNMPELLAAKRLHQLSHMEILREGQRPEARLCRLLGHISIYDNVHRWRTENAEQIHAAETAQRNTSQRLQARQSMHHSNTTSSKSPLKIRTLAVFQAAIRAHLEADKETTVSTEEVPSDDDAEDEINWYEVDSDENLSEESDGEGDWSGEEEDPIIEFI